MQYSVVKLLVIETAVWEGCIGSDLCTTLAGSMFDSVHTVESCVVNRLFNKNQRLNSRCVLRRVRVLIL